MFKLLYRWYKATLLVTPSVFFTFFCWCYGRSRKGPYRIENHFYLLSSFLGVVSFYSRIWRITQAGDLQAFSVSKVVWSTACPGLSYIRLWLGFGSEQHTHELVSFGVPVYCCWPQPARNLFWFRLRELQLSPWSVISVLVILLEALR